MAKIYLSRPRTNNERDYILYKELSYGLTERGHDIIQDDVEYGKDLEVNSRRILNNVDVIIPIITKESIDSNVFYSELIQFRNYVAHSENKLLIPVVSARINLNELPESILNIQFLKVDEESEASFSRLIRQIDESINSFLGKRIASQERAKEIKEQIETNAPGYISETISELSKREKYQRNTALLWYILGFLAICGGVVVALWLANNGLKEFAGKENWSLTVFYALKSLFIIILLIAASKYCFTLAKSYMSESLKIADRVHAISFGKFYLQVFNQQINPTEIKEIFRDWNINNQTNTFSSQTADFDPKLLDRAIEIIDKVRGAEKK